MENKRIGAAIIIVLFFIVVYLLNNIGLTGSAIKSYGIEKKFGDKKVSVFCDDGVVYGNPLKCKNMFIAANYVGASCPAGTNPKTNANNKCYGEGRCPPVGRFFSGMCACEYECV